MLRIFFSASFFFSFVSVAYSYIHRLNNGITCCCCKYSTNTENNPSFMRKKSLRDLYSDFKCLVFFITFSSQFSSYILGFLCLLCIV